MGTSRPDYRIDTVSKIGHEEPGDHGERSDIPRTPMPGKGNKQENTGKKCTDGHSKSHSEGDGSDFDFMVFLLRLYTPPNFSSAPTDAESRGLGTRHLGYNEGFTAGNQVFVILLCRLVRTVACD